MLSIICLHHNKAPYSALLLASLLECEGGPYEYLMVDNGSADATPDHLADFKVQAEAAGHTCQILTFPENIGAIAGRNEAMAVATGDHFAFLDNDLVMRDRDWAVRLLEILDADPTIGIVSPKLVFPWSPYPIEFAGCDVTAGGRIIYRGRGEAIDDPAFNERRDCPCLISACIVFPRAVYDTIGGLDMAYHPVQFEDLDFCYRARQAGWRCVYEPSVEVYHWEHTTTAGSDDVNFKLATLKNGRTFKQRWREVIEAEGGPADELAKWRAIKRFGVDEVPAPGWRR